MITILTNVPTISIGLTFFFLGLARGPTGLNVKEVYTALSLLNLLRSPFIFFPTMVGSALQYKVAFDRIHSFVSREGLPKRSKEQQTKTKSLMIQMTDASFQWPSDSDVPTLTHLDLKVKKGQCCVIVGSVGSGKSTLCQAVLGEVPKVAGECNVYGSFAYVLV
jgi:ABC-type multidrug transport system fused ATPase/permease subunit